MRVGLRSVGSFVLVVLVMVSVMAAMILFLHARAPRNAAASYEQRSSRHTAAKDALEKVVQEANNVAKATRAQQPHATGQPPGSQDLLARINDAVTALASAGSPKGKTLSPYGEQVQRLARSIANRTAASTAMTPVAEKVSTVASALEKEEDTAARAANDEATKNHSREILDLTLGTLALVMGLVLVGLRLKPLTRYISQSGARYLYPGNVPVPNRFDHPERHHHANPGLPVENQPSVRDRPAPPAEPPSAPDRTSGPFRDPRSAGVPRSQKLTATTSGQAGMAFDLAWNAGIWVHAGSVIGPEHRSPKGLAPREDAYGAAPANDPSVLIAAVADGVGSTRDSDVASQLAVEAALSVLQQITVAKLATLWEGKGHWEQLALEVMDAVSGAVREERVNERARLAYPARHSTGRRRPSAPATTLIVALAASYNEIARAVWCAVGDSEVAVLASDSVTWQTTQEDRDHGTRCLPRDHGHVEIGRCHLNPGEALLLMTDGCERVLSLDREAPGLLRKVVDDPHDIVPLVQVLHRYPSGATDDRTLLMLTNGARE